MKLYEITFKNDMTKIAENVIYDMLYNEFNKTGNLQPTMRSEFTFRLTCDELTHDELCLIELSPVVKSIKQM